MLDLYQSRSNLFYQQKLTVANAKCKLIDLAKREKSPTKINPTGKCAQQLAQWAMELNNRTVNSVDVKETLSKDFVFILTHGDQKSSKSGPFSR